MTLKIFLIDDSDLDNFISRAVIQQSHFSEEITVFLAAEIALEHLLAIDSDIERIPDIIFLDINMPMMSGFEFLEKFEKLSTCIKDKTKIIMLSSSVNSEDIDNANANPFVVKYLNKPLSKEKLESLA